MNKIKSNSILALLIVIAIGIFVYTRYSAYLISFTEPSSKLSSKVFNDHYLSNIQKVFDQRCIACHACYNSPCQLNLTSYEGAIRGASKVDPYDFPLLEANPPTRLGVDANSEEGWRKKKFFSVLNSSDKEKPESINDSVLLQMIHASPSKVDKNYAYLAEESRTCPSSIQSADYLKHHAMPFGLPRLSDEEIMTLTDWVLSGFPGPKDKALKILTQSQNSRTLREIENWENLLNKKEYKHQLSARYFYEHLFSGNIYFNDDGREFFKLVRAKNMTGDPVVIATVRPFDDPKTSDFYYRFKKIKESIVHKNHTVFLLNSERLKSFEDSFIKSYWANPEEKLPGYGDEAANPFLIFKNIPVAARYNFFLENARYFIMTFMKGPVCRGQAALNVINDHFWVMFIDPKYDLSVNDARYLEKSIPLLSPPSAQYDNIDVFNKMKDRRWKVHAMKMRTMAKKNMNFDSNWVWNGNSDKKNPNALLTVYRHYDSANVLWGAKGVIPKTMWVMDYQIFEDIYYNLVAGYDVFGPVLHQINTRLYMDVSRISSEDMFITFMPEKERLKMRSQWSSPAPVSQKKGVVEKIFTSIQKEIVEKVKFDYNYEGMNVPSTFIAQSHDPKVEFVRKLMVEKFSDSTFYKSASLDQKSPHRVDTQGFVLEKNALMALEKLNGIKKHFIQFFPDAMFLKVKNRHGNLKNFSMVRNKFHYNVSMIFLEDLRRDASKDTLDIIPGYATSYPNYFLSMNEDKIEEFVDSLDHVKSKADFKDLMLKYGISRSSKYFWSIFDWFNDDIRRVEKIEHGVLDLNRYANF